MSLILTFLGKGAAGRSSIRSLRQRKWLVWVKSLSIGQDSGTTWGLLLTGLLAPLLPKLRPISRLSSLVVPIY